MRMGARNWGMVLIGCLLLAGVALPAIAQTTPAPTTTPAATPPAGCAAYAGLTHKLAGCLRETINDASATFFAQIYPYLENTIAAAMTFAVILYGILLSMGMVEKVGRDTFVVLIKLAAVSAFVTSSPWILSTVTSIMDETAAAVVSYAPSSGAADAAGSDFGQSVCLKNMISQQAAADPSKPVITPWLGIDCLIDSVIGIKIMPGPNDPPDTTGNIYYNTLLNNADPTKSNITVARSLLYFFFSSMQTSVLGAIMAVVGLFFILGLLKLIIRAFFTYIAGYIGITLLVIISPLIIPLLLFKEGYQYFEKWSKMLISFALQPTLMLAFVIFSITAVDLAAFSGNYSIMYNIAGDASRQPGFDLNAYLTAMRHPDGTLLAPNDPNATPLTYPACTDCKSIINPQNRSVANIKADNPTPPTINVKDAGGLFNQAKYSDCTPNNIKADTTGNLKKVCNTFYGFKLQMNRIDWGMMAAAHQPPLPAPTTGTADQQMSRMVLASLFFCCMVVFVLNGVLGIVPAIGTDLLGDYGQSADLASLGGGKGLIGSKLAGITGNITSALGIKK